MKPTIGRIVLYKSQGVLVPAIVVKVWNETCLNLHVFEDGLNHNLAGIKASIGQGGSEGDPADNSWQWPKRDRPDEIQAKLPIEVPVVAVTAPVPAEAVDVQP